MHTQTTPLPPCIHTHIIPLRRRGRPKLLNEQLQKLLHAYSGRNIVGYARVSTTRQMNEGDSLAAQATLIKEYAAQMNRKLVELHTDSTSGALPFTKRSTLQAAVNQAKALGCPILIASPDRLSRNIDVLQHLDLRKTQVWVVGRCRLSRGELDHEIAEAAHGLLQRKEAGVSSWSPSARKKRPSGSNPSARAGALVGSKANKARSDQNVSRVQTVLETRPDALSMTCPDLAQLLNTLEVTNKNGRDHNGPVFWTAETLRRPLSKARKIINARAIPL